MRRYVRRRRQELSLEVREVFMPQSYAWGAEAQVDWYEAWAILNGERVKLQVFEMRSMASGTAYHRAESRPACAIWRLAQGGYIERANRSS